MSLSGLVGILIARVAEAVFITGILSFRCISCLEMLDIVKTIHQVPLTFLKQ